MPKLVFSTLSILVLLISGTNCSTGKRGGEGGGSYPDCKVGLELNPGDGCSGPNYSIHNNDGELVAKGSYIESCSLLIYNRNMTFNGVSYGGRFVCDSLYVNRDKDGNAWTIKRLPPPATTVR